MHCEGGKRTQSGIQNAYRGELAPGRVLTLHGVCDRRPRRGFALIVVLALLSLLVLMVLTLTTQLQLSLVSAKQSIRQEQARLNARFALDVAVAQLQRQAGPDQRVTARADVMINSQQQPGLASDSAQIFWTGVWKSYRPGAPNQELDQGFNEHNQLGANLRAWSLDANNGNAGVDKLDTGGPQWLVSWPAQTTANTTLNPRFGPSPSPTIVDSETATDSGPAFKTLARVLDAATGKLHHVRAWKVPIPGLPAVEGEGTLPGGAYAYWVSDEGVKAKANLVSPWPLTEDNYAENQLNFLTPQRMAVEKMLIDPRPGVNAISALKLAVPGPIDPAHPNLARVHSLGDLANLLPPSAIKPDGKLSGSPGTGYTFSQRFFPDITTWSYGVLSDVRHGGLKYDLTAAFEDVSQYQTLLERTRNMHDDLVNDEKVYRVAPGSMPSASAGATFFRMDGLRWHTLYFYYNLYKPQLPNPFSGVGASPFAGPTAGPAANPSMRMRFYTYPTAVREFALMPRMIMTQIYYGLSYDGSSKLRFHLYPAIVLYNPYNVTLNAPVGVKFHVNTNARLSIQVRRPVTGNNSNPGYEEMPNEGTGSYDYAPSVTERNRRFMLSTSITANYNLEPGELRVYALPGEFQRGEHERLGIVQDLTDRVSHAGNSIYRNVSDWNGSTYVSPLNYNSTDSLVIGNSDIITSDQTGSFEVSTSQTSQLYWPMNTPNPRQEMARLMFRAFDTQVNVPATPITTYQGSNALQLGGLGFHVKPVNPRPVVIDQNLGGVNFAPAPWPALPVFASALPAASPLSNFYEGPMVDHVSEIVPNGPNTDRLSLGAVTESGADGRSYLRARWGLTGNAAGGQTHVVLRDVPRQPLASLGQFMHVNANYWVSAVPVLENTPGVETYVKFNGGFSSPTYDNAVMHPVGGSLAPAMMRGTPASLGVAMSSGGGTVDAVMARRKKFENRIEALPELNGGGGGGGSGGNLSLVTSVLNENNRNVWFRDDNFLANETLFDGYFFSTVPALARNVSALPPVGKVFNSAYVTAGQPLPNSRMAYYFPGGVIPGAANLQNADRAAANLLLDGAFNINSTSVDAWVALLSSMSGYDLRIWNANAGAKSAQTLSATSELRNLSPILRFTSPVATRSATKSLTINQPFEGICALKDDEVRDLATKIVEQIKARGPFLSLGDFLNRRLSNKTSSADNDADLNKNFTLMGALQAAIDNNSTIIQRLRNSPLTARAADKATIDNWQNSNGGSPVMHWFQNRFMYMQQMPIMTRNLPAYNYGGVTGKTFSAQGIPGWLMQQDLVQAFSSVMTARSDTFIIRTYGESADPLTGEITGRAWLEAVVQRYPDFVDPAIPAETRSRYLNDQRIKANALSDLTEPGAPAFNPLIREFGRKFRIVSIRWLNENEI